MTSYMNKHTAQADRNDFSACRNAPISSLFLSPELSSFRIDTWSSSNTAAGATVWRTHVIVCRDIIEIRRASIRQRQCPSTPRRKRIRGTWDILRDHNGSRSIRFRNDELTCIHRIVSPTQVDGCSHDVLWVDRWSTQRYH